MPEEVFLVFIASCISLWLIQLATEWIGRRRDSRRIERGTVMERYRGHLILVKVHQEPDTDVWKATVHVQFNEDTQTFRDVYLAEPTARFTTDKSAEKHALKEAKQWVDDRFRQAKIFDRKESHRGQPLRGIIWFTVAILGFCAVIALLAGYVQKARSLEKISHRITVALRSGE